MSFMAFTATTGWRAAKTTSRPSLDLSVGFQDVIWDLEDGVERIDLRGAGLSLADFTIDDADSSAIITSVAGRLDVMGLGQTGTAGRISADDFIFA
jgi:hypothetical protein